MTADQLFRRGLQEVEAARFESALFFMEQAAAAQPRNFRYQLGLGHVREALGYLPGAAAAYQRATEIEPKSGDAHFAYGSVLQAAARHADAVPAYGHALQLQSDPFAALNNMGICLQRCGRFQEAAAAYARALEIRPAEAGVKANLGTVLGELGRLAEAVALLREASGLAPWNTSHAVNLGMVLCRQREFAEAEGVLTGALAANGECADAAFVLGLAIHGSGRPAAAAGAYQRAVQLRPSFLDAWINLGNVQRELADFAAAAAAYESALRIAPNSVVAINNAGCLLRMLGRFEAAEDILRRGIRVNAEHPALHDNLGSVLKDVGDLPGAIECFRQSLKLQPDNAATHSNLMYAMSFLTDHSQSIIEEGARWNRRFGLAPPITAGRTHAESHRRLRIGYVSPDFREHCQSLFTIPLFAHHDHDSFEIYCYSSVQRSDAYTRRLSSYADTWRDVRSLDDAELAAVIRKDDIDILIDLTMHMANSRLRTFARKPAPIQGSWLAYPGTTGLAAMDFRISDPRLDPAGFDAHYSERTIRLPDSFWCYDPLCKEPQVNALPMLKRGYLTFGCLNNPCKLSESTLRLWGNVMQAVPDSHLVLLAPPGRHGQLLMRRLAAQGIDAQRVRYVPYRARSAYLRSYHEIDVGLDTYPYNGHTTSLDALWMGVPIITRVGATSVGRGGLSQLFQLGLCELAAASDEEFVAIAVHLSADSSKLAQLRVQLRNRLEHSPLMDGARFARHLEAAYRQLWQDHLASAASTASTASAASTAPAAAA